VRNSTGSLRQTPKSNQQPKAVAAAVLGWLVPGAGHFYLGLRARAAVFLLLIGAMFTLGVAMEARLALHVGWDDPLAALTSFAQIAAGLPYLLARGLGHSLGRAEAVTFEYGNTFTAVAGLLNSLVALDAYDIAVGRKS
jgi:TM2 domain-containing membrane protein YozV